jgi:starch synthase (maltosyl-transferring)
MEVDGRKRVVIERVEPEIDGGRFPIKRAVGETVVVSADIFADGHDSISARLLYRKQRDKEWKEVPMRLMENDRWKGEFVVEEVGVYHYSVEGRVDHFKTWQRDLKKKLDAGQDIGSDVLIGARYVEETAERASKEDRKKLIYFAGVLKKGMYTEEMISAVLGEGLVEKRASLAPGMSSFPDPVPKKRGNTGPLRIVSDSFPK